MANDLWGEPPTKRPIRGAYERHGYAPNGRIGPREAGSIFAGATQLQAVFIPASGAIEMLASSSMPQGSAFTIAWLTQSLGFIGLKVLANMLRCYGASLVRDFGAWLWECITYLFGGMWNSSPSSEPKRPGLFQRLFGPRKRRRVIRRRRRVV